MAQKEAFIQELDGQITALKSGQTEITETINRDSPALTELKRRRTERIEEATVSLLPDCTPTTIEALRTKLPGFIDPDQVSRMMDETKATYQTQLDRLTAEYNPAQYEATKIDLEHKLGKAQADLEALKEPVERLERNTWIRRLIESGYGTSEYQFHWWDFLFLAGFQFYYDWRDADAACEFAQVETFDALKDTYTQGRKALDITLENVRTCQRQLKELEQNKARHTELTEALAKVPGMVLERLRTKLRGWLDLEPVPAVVGDLNAMNVEITRLQNSLPALRDTRSKIQEQITKLTEMKSKVMRSTKRDVPEDYMTRLRSRRPTVSSGGWSSPTTIHVYSQPSNTGFLDGVLIGEMDSYFRESVTHDRGGYSPTPTYRTETRRWATSDRSGSS